MRYPTMPTGWKPGRCIVQYDITQSCPFSKRGCWVRLPENCPFNEKPAEEKPEQEVKNAD